MSIRYVGLTLVSCEPRLALMCPARCAWASRGVRVCARVFVRCDLTRRAVLARRPAARAARAVGEAARRRGTERRLFRLLTPTAVKRRTQHFSVRAPSESACCAACAAIASKASAWNGPFGCRWRGTTTVSRDRRGRRLKSSAKRSGRFGLGPAGTYAGHTLSSQTCAAGAGMEGGAARSRLVTWACGWRPACVARRWRGRGAARPRRNPSST